MDFYENCHRALFHPGGCDLTRYAVGLCGFGEGAVIADIGCGTGDTSALLEDTFPITVLNTEPSPAMRGDTPGIINAAAESLPFADGYLDGALCECTLSLCEALTPALTELSRVIKPDGSLIVADVYSRADTFKASGALKWLYAKESYLSAVTDCGFYITLFEEHSKALAEMAARLILEGANDALCDTFRGIDRKKAGYFLLIARRRRER